MLPNAILIFSHFSHSQCIHIFSLKIHTWETNVVSRNKCIREERNDWT